jgi:hypothetical protein
MGANGRGTARRVATALLLVVLTVPLVLSAHRHGAQELQDQNCAACILVRHSPVLAAVTIAAVAPDVAKPAVECGPILPVTGLRQSPQAGRAPPARPPGIAA